MLNAGLLVSKRAREIVGDEVLKTVFEEAKLSYVAEIGDFIFEDLKQNDVKSLLVINDGDRETWMEDIDQRLGISPLAVITIPYTWFEGKSGDFTLALLMGYSLKAELMDLVYRVQPTRSSSISRRSLIKLKVYEYKP
ncbi:MAG: 4Fe-4S ferredoxin, partial [Metallosphaera sp.]